MGALEAKLKTLLITGAGGYLGRYTVAAARARGHKVRALVRRSESAPQHWREDAGIELVVLDLAVPGAGLAAALSGIDAVIHIAASLSGDDATHQRDTLDASARLYQAIAAMAEPVPVVLAGSMAVYRGVAGEIDEDSALEPAPAGRDAYCRAKLAQEAIACEATGMGISTCILRLGAVFGPGRLWNGHIGVRLGPLLLLMAGRGGALPLVYAPHAAQALVRAAERLLSPVTSPGASPVASPATPPAISPARSLASVEALNIVDDNLPDARRYLGALPRRARPRLRLPLPWQLLMPPARLARLLRLPAPGLLRPATLAARMAPRQYRNSRAKAALGWVPATRLATALAEERRVP